MAGSQPRIDNPTRPTHLVDGDGDREDRRPEPLGTVRTLALPAAARNLSTLARLDYTDAFLVQIAPTPERTGEQWARAVLEGAPIAMRNQLRCGWLALGLKLDLTRSERHVLGWEVRHSTPDLAILGAGSRSGMPAELLFKPQGHTLLFATFVQHRNPAVRVMWAGVVPAHQRVVPYLLKRAACSQLHAGPTCGSEPGRTGDSEPRG